MGNISILVCGSPGRLGMGSGMPTGWGGGGGQVQARELRSGVGVRHSAGARGGSREHMRPRSSQRMEPRLRSSAGPGSRQGWG